MDHAARMRRLQEGLAEHSLDALLITHPANIRYLCGFSGSAGALLVGDDGAVFFSDGRYTSQAREEVKGARTLTVRQAPYLSAGEWLARARKKARRRGRQTLGIEADHLTVNAQRRLRKVLPSGLRLRAAPLLVEQARMIKDEEEIERIRRAVLMGSSLFDTALNVIRVGATEAEVAAEIEYAARKAGAEGMSFETIVAAGARSALPHGRASEQRIPAKGFVVCDFGVILAGYCSDMTRTVHVGALEGESRGAYEAVREAQQAATEAVRPGAAVGKVDRAARSVLKSAGLARYLTHSTGHGVGLEIHEAPRVAAGQEDILRPGMVVTIEPGIYIPGKWGVRIEDMVVVTEKGSEVLTPTGKQLIEL